MMARETGLETATSPLQVDNRTQLGPAVRFCKFNKEKASIEETFALASYCESLWTKMPKKLTSM